MSAERVRYRALRLEVEQLTPLVAQVGDDDEQQSDERKGEGCERSGGERQQRAARKRLGPEVGEQRIVRCHVERVEWGSTQRSGDGVLPVTRRIEPDLIGT